MPAGSPNSPHDSMLGLTLQELTDLVLETGEPAYRAQQLFDAVYRQGIDALEDISTLPRPYRARIAEQGWRVGSPAITRQFESADGTIRYLMELAGGEAGGMPKGEDGERGAGGEASDEIQSPSAGSTAHRRAAICVSSQVGCAVN